MIEELSQDNFAEKVIDSPKACVVDFWAPWCRPCIPVSDALEKLSTEYDGQINFFKVNIIDNTTLTFDLQITEVPTIIFYKDPEHIDIQRGTAKEEQLKDKIDALLGG